MYHGIIIDQSFKNIDFPNKFKIFAKKQDGDWGIYGIEIEDKDLDNSISKMQNAMKVGKWYMHFYNDEDLVVVFKDRVLRVKPDKSSWGLILEHGRKLEIPEEQLDFWPNRFQDEVHYFAEEDFMK